MCGAIPLWIFFFYLDYISHAKSNLLDGCMLTTWTDAWECLTFWEWQNYFRMPFLACEMGGLGSCPCNLSKTAKECKRPKWIRMITSQTAVFSAAILHNALWWAVNQNFTIHSGGKPKHLFFFVPFLLVYLDDAQLPDATATCLPGDRQHQAVHYWPS